MQTLKIQYCTNDKSTENVKKIHNFVGKLIPSNTFNMSQIPV